MYVWGNWDQEMEQGQHLGRYVLLKGDMEEHGVRLDIQSDLVLERWWGSGTFAGATSEYNTIACSRCHCLVVYFVFTATRGYM